VPKQATIEVLRTNLREHPAVKAWSELQPDRVEPEWIETLREGKTSSLYRLEGVGMGGSAVIAKRSRRGTLPVEHKMYTEVLPHFPMPSLRCYGFFEKPDDKFCWLFLEDAGGEQYSPHIEAHQALTARWLGTLHTTIAPAGLDIQLPDRGPNYYLEHLQLAGGAIQQQLGNPTFHLDYQAVLESIASQLHFLENRWSLVEDFCNSMPRTIVHGDLVAKNVRIRMSATGITLLPFDWETAGWGVPAADLAWSRHKAVSPDIAVYWSIVQPFWPHLDLQDIRKLANFGRVFRSLISVSWEKWSLRYPWAEGNMRMYEANLADSIRTLGWKN